MEGMGNSPCPSKHSPKIHGSQSKIETPEHRSKQGNFTCWETKPKLWLWQWCYKRVTRNSDTGAALLLDAIKNLLKLHSYLLKSDPFDLIRVLLCTYLTFLLFLLILFLISINLVFRQGFSSQFQAFFLLQSSIICSDNSISSLFLFFNLAPESLILPPYAILR